VNARDAEEWSHGADCAHFVASAKDNTGVDEVFAELARRAAQYVSTKADTNAAGPNKGRRDVIRNIEYLPTPRLLLPPYVRAALLADSSSPSLQRL
jgi:hypothetical protein